MGSDSLQGTRVVLQCFVQIGRRGSQRKVVAFFLFALQNPLVAGFVQIERHDAPPHVASPEAVMAEAADKVVDCAFVISRETDRVYLARESTFHG